MKKFRLFEYDLPKTVGKGGTIRESNEDAAYHDTGKDTDSVANLLMGGGCTGPPRNKKKAMSEHITLSIGISRGYHNGMQ